MAARKQKRKIKEEIIMKERAAVPGRGGRKRGCNGERETDGVD